MKSEQRHEHERKIAQNIKIDHEEESDEEKYDAMKKAHVITNYRTVVKTSHKHHSIDISEPINIPINVDETGWDTKNEDFPNKPIMYDRLEYLYKEKEEISPRIKEFKDMEKAATKAIKKQKT